MTEITYHHPLQWPKNTPVTPINARGFNNGFPHDMKLEEALNYLEEELREIKFQRVCIYSDYEQLKVERLRRKTGSSNAMSIELKISGQHFFMGCDRWQMLEHNAYALHLALRNLKMMERWGIGDFSRLMQGFAELKSSNSHITQTSTAYTEWMQILGLGPSATLEDAHAVYRRRAKLVANEPDVLMKLNTAMDEARKALE